MSSIFPMTNDSSRFPRESRCSSEVIKREGDLIYSIILLLHIVSVLLPCNATFLYLLFSLLIYDFFLSTSFFSHLSILCFLSSPLSHTQMLQPLYSERSSESGHHFWRIGILVRTRDDSDSDPSQPIISRIRDRRWRSTRTHVWRKPNYDKDQWGTRAPSDQSTSQPSSKMDKGKAKMLEYEDDQFDGNELTLSLDNEFNGFDVPLLRTLGVKKAISMTIQKLCRSTR